MAAVTIPVIDLDIEPFVGNPIELEVVQNNPIEVEVGLTLPGPPGPPAEIYYGTELPPPELGNEGALYVRYITPVE